MQEACLTKRNPEYYDPQAFQHIILLAAAFLRELV